MPLNRRAVVASLFLPLLIGADPAAAQSYPTKPVTVIVPFAAGGPTDVVARLIGDHMTRTLGQQIVVENVGGAGGSTGMSRVAAATPDGYTLGVGNMGTQTAAPFLYQNLKYDPAKSFDQISILNFTPQTIVSKKDIDAKDLKALLAHLKANEAKISYGHAGVGSISHVAGTLFNAQMGLKPALVAYRGTGPALQDIVAGKIDYMVDQSLNVIPQVQSGTIKAYAVAAPARLKALPNVPTTKEAGVDFIFSAWNAMVGPKGLPPDVAKKILDAVGKALDDAAIIAKFEELGSTAPGRADRGPAALQKLVESEMARIGPALKATGEQAK